jgi:hypothetical protein
MLASRNIQYALSACAIIALSSTAGAAVQLPSGGSVEKVDFERHVMGLFGKAGCNNGSCHGSFQGKNGFRLSLFGYDPDRDYRALTRDLSSRRVNQENPDESLLLMKATGAMKHDGTARFSKDSWQYNIIRQWIQDGSAWKAGSGEVVALEMSPKEYIFCKPGETKRVKITAKFKDGSVEDITPFCDFRVQDDAVANIDPFGLISGIKSGDSGLVVLYRGNVVSARVLVPMPARDNLKYPESVNYIDKEVFIKLRQMNMVPSEAASDGEFLRRIYIDTIGMLPTPDEVRAFLADKSADKRERKIDELLKHPLHAALWATKLSDITGNNTTALENPQNLRIARSQQWHDWIRKRIADNMPYDELVKNILLATSRDNLSPAEWLDKAKANEEEMAKLDTTHYVERQTLDLFWRRAQQVQSDIWGQKVAAAFLGVRIECAECHKHPTDRWTQNDYRAFGNFFTQVSFNQTYSSPEIKKLVDALVAEKVAAAKDKKVNTNQIAPRELYVGEQPIAPRQNRLNSSTPLIPKALGGPQIPFEKGKDIRVELFNWMRSPDNPYFARSFVNRIWAHYTGMGLVDPVDDFSLANPPNNARLLDALAKDFVEHKFDIRYMERTILLSRTYQTSATPNPTNKLDKNNFARAYVRPMMAEVFVDVLNSGLGVTEKFGNSYPAGKHMIEVGATQINNNGDLTYALRIFGRPARTTACDCERTMEPALSQTLFRMTDSSVMEKLKLSTNRVGVALDSKKTDDQILEDLFLATLTRLPSADEKSAFDKFRQNQKNRNVLFTDTMWALINTREFVLNH